MRAALRLAVVAGLHARSCGVLGAFPTDFVRERALGVCGTPPVHALTDETAAFFNPGTIQHLCDWHHLCGGAGDRMRGMTLLWLLAMDEKVRFEVQWVRPLDMHSKGIFVPRPGHDYR